MSDIAGTHDTRLNWPHHGFMRSPDSHLLVTLDRVAGGLGDLNASSPNPPRAEVEAIRVDPATFFPIDGSASNSSKARIPGWSTATDLTSLPRLLKWEQVDWAF